MSTAAALAAILAGPTLDPSCNPRPAAFLDGVAVAVLALVALAGLAAWRTRPGRKPRRP